MEENYSKKASKRPERKSKSKKKSYSPENEDDEENDFGPVIQQEQQIMQSKIPIPPPLPPPLPPPPMKHRKAIHHSEPIEMYQTKNASKFPSKIPPQQMIKGKNYVQQEQNMDSFERYDAQMLGDDFPGSYSPLPPIASTQNLNEILSIRLQSLSIKAFKVNKFKEYYINSFF